MRISLISGPGTGKSTTAAWLFSELKLRKVSVELCQEYVKSWAIEKRKVDSFHQIYLFAKQLNTEYRCLNNGVKNIVSDSPTFLSSIYADYYYPQLGIGKDIQNLNRTFDREFPPFFIYLTRGNKSYIQEGRYQTLDEARRIDDIARAKLFNEYPEDKIFVANYLDRDRILNKVLEVIDK